MQSCLPVHMAGQPAPLIGTQCKPMPALIATSPVKDSRWLTLEVCREFARNKCPRSENECRYAHPPSDVEIQTGRVVCCFDSIKGRCQRTSPACKYLHPPQHLKEQLLQNGRNNLIRRNLQLNAAACFLPTIYPMFSPLVIDNNNNGYYTSPVVVNPTPINIQYAVSPNYPNTNTPTNNNSSNVCNNAYLNNTINNNLNNNIVNNNNNTIPAIMPANRQSNDDEINNNINNNIHNNINNNINNNNINHNMNNNINNNINHNINNNEHQQYEICNADQLEKMVYTPSNSSPSHIASPDYSNPQTYWTTSQPVMDPSSQDPLSAYYPPLILQVSGSINGTHGFYPALLKQTMDTINNNISTTSTLSSTTTTTNNNSNGKSCTVSNTSTSNNNPVFVNNINNNNNNNNLNNINISSNNGLFTPIYPCGLQYGNASVHTNPMTYPLPQPMQQQQQLTQPQHCYPISISGSMQASTIQRY